MLLMNSLFVVVKKCSLTTNFIDLLYHLPYALN